MSAADRSRSDGRRHQRVLHPGSAASDTRPLDTRYFRGPTGQMLIQPTGASPARELPIAQQNASEITQQRNTFMPPPGLERMAPAVPAQPSPDVIALLDSIRALTAALTPAAVPPPVAPQQVAMVEDSGPTPGPTPIPTSSTPTVFTSDSKARMAFHSSLNASVTDWERKTTKLLTSDMAQKDLRVKYEDMESRNSMHRDFQQEGEQSWQFNSEYLADQMEQAIDVAELWKTMRSKHAKECWDFVVARQREALELLETQLSHQSLVNFLVLALDDKTTRVGAAFDDGFRARYVSLTVPFINCWKAERMSAFESKKHSLVVKKQQQEKALQDASDKFEAMSPLDISMCVLAETLYMPKGKKNPVNISKHKLLGQWLQRNEEFAKERGFKVTDSKKDQSYRGQSGSRTSSANRSRGGSRGRSGSKSGGQSTKTEKGKGGKGKGKGKRGNSRGKKGRSKSRNGGSRKGSAGHTPKPKKKVSFAQPQKR
eukprot:TRINITY_DN43954_c0_g3_i1.p2 TRINITY_DN43954_c0_g3~~TRINITY_DN43954_c0_g3_i1.p2  ORF type:complete len:485 (-),score=90.50 TRINITY_DN43954_c0_g3_i1:2034-3488(-)